MAINVLKGDVIIHNYVEKGATVENKYYGKVIQGTAGTVTDEDADVQEQDEDLQQELMPFFWNDAQNVAQFLKTIAGAKDTDITATVAQYVREKKISELSCHKDLWEVLNRHGRYLSKLSNWNQRIAENGRKNGF